MPALAAMGGLMTAPFLLYDIVGFDVLHARFLSTLVCCLFAGYFVGMALTWMTCGG